MTIYLDRGPFLTIPDKLHPGKYRVIRNPEWQGELPEIVSFTDFLKWNYTVDYGNYLRDTPCKHPGCAALVPYGTKYCDKHKPLHPEDTRSAGSRGYGSAWNKARKRYLETHPLCVECMKRGRYVKATDVDHIKPHRGDKILFWDQNNWQSLCHSCHSIKTRNEDHTPEYKY